VSNNYSRSRSQNMVFGLLAALARLEAPAIARQTIGRGHSSWDAHAMDMVYVPPIKRS